MDTYDFAMVSALPLHFQNVSDSNLSPYTSQDHLS